MPRFPITEHEADEFIAAEKVVNENFAWERKSDGGWVQSKLRVLVPALRTDALLELIVTVNTEEPRRCSLSLILNSAHRIYALDVLGSHRN
jgi:hypothetical protein